MRQQSRKSHVAAMLAAAACLTFAAGVGAAEVNDDKAFADSPTAVCHPAYRPCQKEEPKPAMTSAASADTKYVALGEFNHEMAGSVCHPAYRACSNWTLWVVTSK
jgi:hypothetical protein